jgi:hypothetical protein
MRRWFQARINQQTLILDEPNEQPSTVDVSMVTVAPILVVLAAGYVTGVLYYWSSDVSMETVKCWSRGSVRKWRQNWILKSAVQLTAVSIKPTATHTDVIFTYYCMIVFNSTLFSVSRSIIWLLSRFNQKICAILLLLSHATQSEKAIFRSWEKSFKPTREKDRLHDNSNENG